MEIIKQLKFQDVIDFILIHLRQLYPILLFDFFKNLSHFILILKNRLDLYDE
jgi:hypothetical protein